MSQSPTLSAMLALLRVDMADSAVAELAAPAAVSFTGDRRAYFHLAVSGSLTLEIADAPAPVRIDEGAYAIVLGGRAHTVGDAPGRAPAEARYFREEHQLDQPPTIRFGGDGAVTRVLSSAFSVEPPGRVMLRGLPDLLVGGSVLRPDGVAAMLEGPGAMAMIPALIDLCLAQSARAALISRPAPEGDAPALLQHRQISAAVKLVKERPSDKWTVARLANAVGMSRSSFASAFRDHVGEAPAEYVTGVRMRFAAALLTSERSLVCDVARRAGYDSDSSFIRAFKKRYGAAPSEFRRSAGPARPAAAREYRT